MHVSTATVTAGVIMFALMIAGVVGLAFAGWDGAAIVGLISGVLGLSGGVLVIIEKLSRLHIGQVDRARIQDKQGVTLDQQSTKLDTIERRVNGELDGRIQAAVQAALTAAKDAQEGRQAA